MTITLTREEAQQVLDALANAAWCVQRNNLPPDDGHDWDKELELLRTRLAQPEPEPVAYRVWGRMGSISFRHTKPHESEYVEWDELYPAPPQREWQGLTDEEIDQVAASFGYGYIDVARAIESKLKGKNT
jgi:hypothetical protein